MHIGIFINATDIAILFIYFSHGFWLMILMNIHYGHIPLSNLKDSVTQKCFDFFFYKKYIKETLVYSPFTYQNKIKIAYAAIVKTHCNLKRMSQRILLFVKKSI